MVNVSSPNTPGLRELQEKESLRKILTQLQEFNKKQPQQKPLFLKISPDLSLSQLDDVINLAMEIQLDGLVVSNTTISREGLLCTPEELAKIGTGGLSGQPLQKKSTEFIQYISKKNRSPVPVIGSGGIFNIPDVEEKMEAGAGLIQVWTGFIYLGPGLVKKLLNASLILKNLRQRSKVSLYFSSVNGVSSCHRLLNNSFPVLK